MQRGKNQEEAMAVKVTAVAEVEVVGAIVLVRLHPDLIDPLENENTLDLLIKLQKAHVKTERRIMMVM